MLTLTITEEHLNRAIKAKEKEGYSIIRECVVGIAAQDEFGYNFISCADGRLNIHDHNGYGNGFGSGYYPFEDNKSSEEKRVVLAHIMNAFDVEDYESIRKQLPISFELGRIIL